MALPPSRVLQLHSFHRRKRPPIMPLLLLTALLACAATAARGQHVVIASHTAVPPGAVVQADSLTVASGASYTLTNATLLVSGNVTVWGALSAYAGAVVAVGGNLTALNVWTSERAMLSVGGQWRILAGGSLSVSDSSRLNVTLGFSADVGATVSMGVNATLRVESSLDLNQSILAFVGHSASVSTAGDAILSRLTFQADHGALSVGGDLTYLTYVDASVSPSYSEARCTVRVGGTLRFQSSKGLSLQNEGTTISAQNIISSDGGFSTSGTLVVAENVTVRSGSIEASGAASVGGSVTVHAGYLSASIASIGGSLHACPGIVSDNATSTRCTLRATFDPRRGLNISGDVVVGSWSDVSLSAGQATVTPAGMTAASSAGSVAAVLRIGGSLALPADGEPWGMEIASGWVPLIVTTPTRALVFPRMVARGYGFIGRGFVGVFGAVQFAAPNITLNTGSQVHCTGTGSWFGSTAAAPAATWQNTVSSPWALPTPKKLCSIAFNATNTLVLNGTVDAAQQSGDSCSSRDSYADCISAGSVVIEASTLARSTGSLVVGHRNSWAGRVFNGGQVSIKCKTSPFAAANFSEWPLFISVQAGFSSTRACCSNTDSPGSAGSLYIDCAKEGARLVSHGRVCFHDSGSSYCGGFDDSQYDPSRGRGHYTTSSGLILPLPLRSAVRLGEHMVIDSEPSRFTCAGSVCLLQVQRGFPVSIAVRRPILQQLIAHPQFYNFDLSTRYTGADPWRTSLSYDPKVMLQQSDTLLFTPETFATARFFALTGDVLRGVPASSEPMCGLACVEAPGCTGYSIGGATYPAGLLAQAALPATWDMGMTHTNEQYANCLLFANITGLIPDMQSRSGVVQSVVLSAGGGVPGLAS